MIAAQIRILAVLGSFVAAIAAVTAVLFLTDAGAGRRRERVGAVAPLGTNTDLVEGASVTSGAGAASVTPTRTVTTIATPSPRPTFTRRGAFVHADSGVNVRAGPGVAYAVIAGLQAGDEAGIIGRNADTSWLLIDIPIGSGWVSAEVVEVTGDLSAVPLADANGLLRTPTPTATTIATLTPSVTPSVTRTPTRTPLASGATPAGATATGTATVRASATVAGLPDLVLEEVSAGPAGQLTVIISNAGPGALTARRVSVTGVDDDGVTVFSEVTAPLTIAPGAAVNVQLAFRPTAAATLTVTINGDGAVEEVSTANNRRRVIIRP